MAKMNKLFKRCNDIAELVPHQEVLPVLATPWNRRDMTDDVENAAKAKEIALVTREGLEGSARRATRAVDWTGPVAARPSRSA